MSKGDWRRPCNVSREESDRNYEAVFGKKKLNNMSDKDREELDVERIRNAAGETGGPVSQHQHDSGYVQSTGKETSPSLSTMEKDPQ